MKGVGIRAASPPTWRLLWNQILAFHDRRANQRAERLVLRFMARKWSTEQIEQLLTHVIWRDIAPRAKQSRHSLARANGWGSAGQCPASAAKTPAAREQVSLVEAAVPQDSSTSACASAHPPLPEAGA